MVVGTHVCGAGGMRHRPSSEVRGLPARYPRARAKGAIVSAQCCGSVAYTPKVAKPAAASPVR
jgi:hypothetical protein